jgi:hypothetical protein
VASAARELLATRVAEIAAFPADDVALGQNFPKATLHPFLYALQTRYLAAHHDRRNAREFVARWAAKQIGKSRTAPLVRQHRKPTTGGDFGQMGERFVRFAARAFR